MHASALGRRSPAAVGARLADVLTPCLLVSLPAFEANDAAMRAKLRGTGVALRPHAKAHKCSGLAAYQQSLAGSEIAGFCTQTIAETEALVRNGGCRDVLLTNELPPAAAQRLALLAADYPDARLGALVDHPSHVAALNDAARDAGARIRALVEIDCGQSRCGVPPASDASLELAKAIGSAPALDFGGLHVYQGAIQHVRSAAERRARVEAGPADAARRTIARLASAGIEVQVVTGGGTGTYAHDLAAATHNELQPGSYLFMDSDYASNEDSEFSQSMFIHTSVISMSESDGRRVLDAGTKAVDLLAGMPSLSLSLHAASAEGGGGLSEEEAAAVSYAAGGDEHGILHGVPAGKLPVGSTVQLVPSHVDPTFNLHDFVVGVRDGLVESVWEVDARRFF